VEVENFVGLRAVNKKEEEGGRKFHLFCFTALAMEFGKNRFILPSVNKLFTRL
jgi:hypothetical protein